MNDKILKHYLKYSIFTDPGYYRDYLNEKLPQNINEIGFLVKKQLIHPIVLKNGNTGSNADHKYGDMTKIPWYRQSEDALLPTAIAMISELFRKDKRGFIKSRKEKDRLIVTCRSVAILIASILKSKSIPARVRSGFASYFEMEGLEGKSVDHWINQYWSKDRNRWITIDVDGSLVDYLKFDPYDMPKNVFNFSADAWLDVRSSKVDVNHFWNASEFEGLLIIAWELFYDFHSLMNNEIVYFHTPAFVHIRNFYDLKEEELKEIDKLAKLMQYPDTNFEKLKFLWETKKEFRILKGELL